MSSTWPSPLSVSSWGSSCFYSTITESCYFSEVSAILCSSLFYAHRPSFASELSVHAKTSCTHPSRIGPSRTLSRSLPPSFFRSSCSICDLPFSVSMDTEHNALVVAIRGTLSLQDCVTDGLARKPRGAVLACNLVFNMSFLPSVPLNVSEDPAFVAACLDYPIPAGEVFVHTGFWRAAKQLAEILKCAALSCMCRLPGDARRCGVAGRKASFVPQKEHPSKQAPASRRIR